MSGLFMLALLILWLIFAIIIGRWIGRRFKQPATRTVGTLITFVVLVPLPVVDELIGMWQFDALCKKGAVFQVDSERIKGKSIRLVVDPSWAKVPNTAIPISYSRYSYRDVSRNEELASYIHYDAQGGWLVHALGLFEGGSVPLVMGKPWCGPADRGALPKAYGFTLTN